MDGDSMLGQPPGWHRDPAPRNPAAPDTMRFWDGVAWTARTRAGTGRQRRQWREEVAAERLVAANDLLERADAGDEGALWQLAVAAGTPHDPRLTAGTRDGRRYGGWWARVGAAVVDSTLMSVVGTLLAWRFIHQLVTATSRWAEAAAVAADRGRPVPSTSLLLEQVTGPLLGLTVVYVLTSLVYEVGFLLAFQATPGKLLLGLQVRPGDAPGPVPLGAAVLRWTGKSGVGLVQLLPLGFLPYGLYVLLDYLWPLGDSKNQALHDKLARTYVVRRA